jgi:fermentation-respiration switch protein FrsA (DUF1100 family)
MMIVGLNDAITLADVAVAAYERALQPKKLVTIAGGHFEPYLKRFDDSSSAARAWFTEHLTWRPRNPATSRISKNLSWKGTSS